MSVEQTVPPPNGELTEEEVAFISEHMAACAEYLEHLDPLWIGGDEPLDEAAIAQFEIDIPDMPEGLAAKLQQRVSNGINRGNLTSSALTLGTKGMMEVLMAMIRPILAPNKSK